MEDDMLIGEKLNSEFKKKWVKALRSGEYKQIDSALFNGQGYCCLGVACKVAGHELGVTENTLIPDEYENVPPILRVSTTGIFSEPMTIEGNSTRHLDNYLAIMNDSGMSFNEIANWIEENL